MHDALVLARLALAVVFIAAAAGKLLDGAGSRKALVDFAVPEGLVDPLVLLLPLAELATAAALVSSSTAKWGGGAALLLLSGFIVGLTLALRRGAAPDCHCFGQVHSEPASWSTVGRNVALALPAALVLGAGPGPSLGSWANAHTAEGLWLIASASLAVVATATCIVLWRQNRRLRSAQPQTWTPPQPLRVGSRAPRFSLPSSGGPLVTLDDLLADERLCLLTFVAPGCAPCATLLPELVRWSGTFADRLAMPVVSAGDAAMADQIASEHRLSQVLADPGATVSQDYRVPGTPCAILIAPDGTLRSAPAAGQPAIEALIRVALAGNEPPPAIKVHQVAGTR